MTQFELIRKDVLHLNSIFYKADGLIPSFISNIDTSRHTIGSKTSKIIKKNHYADDFDEIINKGLFLLRFKDDSLILAHYIFDSNGDAIKFSLSFLPYYESDVFLAKGDTDEVLSKCIRIDFDSQSSHSTVHSKTHFHTSFFYGGIRIPVTDIVYPSEFLYIILLFNYNYDWKLLLNYCFSLQKGCIPINSLEKSVISLQILKQATSE